MYFMLQLEATEILEETIYHQSFCVFEFVFLTDRHLSADYKKGFDTVFSELSAPSAAWTRSTDSLCERVAGIEPA